MNVPLSADSQAVASPVQNERKTILFFDHTASLGGGEVALLNLVQGLNRERYRPLIILGSEGPLQNKLRESGVETRVLPIANDVVQTRKDTLGVGSLLRLRAMTHSTGYALRLARVIRQENAALVHTNSLKSDIIGGLAARLARVPVIWHVRDRIETDYLPRSIVLLFRRLCRFVPNYIIANSTATLQTLHLPPSRQASTVYSGVSSERGRVVHDGVAAAAFSQERVEASLHPVVGLIGRISPWKGQHIFVEMAGLVHVRFPNARFQICGSPLFGEEAYEAEVRAQVGRLGLEDCVEFLGFRSDVYSVIQKMDIVVHASTTGEPFGQVIVEGMAAGKPVVATRGGGVPEIVEDGVTGRLVPMNDVPEMVGAVLDLLSDPDAACAMGQAGYRRVQERFTIEHSIQRVESIYDSILGSG